MKILGLTKSVLEQNTDIKNKYNIYINKILYDLFQSIYINNKNYQFKILNFKSKLNKFGNDYEKLKTLLDSYDLYIYLDK
jgi:hypothetical protein